MKTIGLGLTTLLCLSAATFAQETDAPSWADTVSWRCVGPANMGGRITSISVYEADPCIYYVATASGGLLKTTNNGQTYEHLFDQETTVSIGDVKVCQSNPDIVWVGTGENNPRNSVSFGNGVYKSTDGGKTWQHMGLEKTFQTGAIVIHPDDPNTVFVGALGRLYGPNEERGLYKTTDGGENWEKVLYVDEKTGVIEVEMHPANSDVLLVATYDRERDGFDTNDPARKFGPGAGIWRSTDGGDSFERVTDGLPDINMGRIGFDFYRKDPDVVFAVIETEMIAKRPDSIGWSGFNTENAEVGAKVASVEDDSPAKEAGLEEGDIIISANGQTIASNAKLTDSLAGLEVGTELSFEIIRKGEAMSLDLTLAERPKPEEDEEGGNRRRRRGDPYSSGLGGQVANIQKQQGKDGYNYGGIYKSEDAGASWTRINSLNPRPMYYSHIKVDPSDSNNLWVCGTSFHKSTDGGKTFSSDGANRGVHVDHHAIWVDPKDGRHLILGNDGGIYVTHDSGSNWDHHNHIAIGQFYHVAVGPRRDYRVYGGLQDNGTWGGPSVSRTGGGLNQDWIRVGGGDGFIVQVDRDDPDLVYYESQNGATGRSNLRTGERGSTRGRAPRGERARYNWKTPFILSSHNTKIYYNAGNYVFRSLNKGSGMRRISDDITRTDRGSATALAESPINPDVLYVGSDDGALWMTETAGHEWVNLRSLPTKKPPNPRPRRRRANKMVS